MISPFGAVVSRGQVAQAALDTLQASPAGSAFPLIAFAVADLERQRGVPARATPLPGGYRVGIDFETFTADDLPAVIATAQPVDAAESYEDAYAQWFEIAVAVVAEDPNGDELVAMQTADILGAAVMLTLTQNRALGGLASLTILESSPDAEFIDGAARRFVRSTCRLRSLVPQVVQEDGPISVGTDPYTSPPLPPNVASVDIQLQSESVLGALGPASGASVTDSAGHVVIGE